MRTIKENNKLIAEFMGLYNKSGLTHPFAGQNMDIEDARYHESWDWLMPVVAKLKIASNEDSFLDNLHKNGDDVCIEGMRLEHQMDMTFKCDYISVENTYKYAVKFIKWYNENKKT